VKLAYFDCFSGASGDMILGALLDAGLDLTILESELSKLGLEGYELSVERVKRRGIAGTKFTISLASQQQPHRHLHHIEDLIRGADLSDRVKEQSLRVFGRLAEAEAAVHGTSVQEVHFHEVGAVDAIIDIVGAAIGLEALGIDEVYCSPLATGSGFVDCEHGRLPVPAPATTELLKGVPSRAGDVEMELLTPTGAAILTTVSKGFGPRPCFTANATSYGAGERDLEAQPNLLRLFLGQRDPCAECDQVWVVETNLDDASGQEIGFVSERLFQAGALDVFSVPIQMKKSRPAVLLTVITDEEHLGAVEDLLLQQTTTFGVRRHLTERRKLDREIVNVDTPYGPVRVKVGRMAGRAVKASPEYEDCRKLAEQRDLPFTRVHDAAFAESRRLLQSF